VLVGVFAYSINYRNEKIASSSTGSSDKIEYSTQDSTLTDSDIVAENKEAGYKLYLKDSVATVTYNDTVSLDFYNWKKSISLETPTLYYNDYDGDGEKELIIPIIDDYTDITGETYYSHTLYIFKTSVENGETVLNYYAAQSSDWKTVFNNAVKFEITQLPNCKKILQFALNDVGKDINYDAETGITDDKYVSYAKAVCGEDKQYYTYSSYNIGLGFYNVQDDGTITLDIQVLVKFEEDSENYYIGNIHCQMTVGESSFGVKANTIYFDVADDYKVNDPRETADESWSYTINNLSTSTKSSKTISSVNAEFTLSSYNTSESQYFENLTGGIQEIDTVTITDKSITLTPQSGYSFDKTKINNGKFEVDVDGVDISYTATISDNALVITFDKSYSKDDISSISVKFGL
jgi:hypothetical protein